jgi:hypothetical protein
MRRIRQTTETANHGKIGLVTYKSQLTNEKLKYFSHSRKDNGVGGMQNADNDNNQKVTTGTGLTNSVSCFQTALVKEATLIVCEEVCAMNDFLHRL